MESEDMKRLLRTQEAILNRLDRIIVLMLKQQGDTTAALPTEESVDDGPSEVPSRSKPQKDRVSDEIFTQKAPGLIRLLLDGDPRTGRLVNVIATHVGVSRHTASRILKRIEASEEFVEVAPTGFTRITDFAAAEQWLRNFDPPRPIRKMDAYNTQQVARMVAILLREDVRTVGKMTRSLAMELGISRTSTERLVNLALDSLPFLTKAKSGLSRVKPDQIEMAKSWLAEAEKMSQEAELIVSEPISDEAFQEKAPRIVLALLDKKDGMVSIDIQTELNIRRGTLVAILARLSAEEKFVSVSVAARGHSPTVRITNVEAAEQWLSERTAPSPKSLNGASTTAPISDVKRLN